MGLSVSAVGGQLLFIEATKTVGISVCAGFGFSRLKRLSKYLGVSQKLGILFLGGPKNEDYSILGSILGFPLFWETTIYICG